MMDAPFSYGRVSYGWKCGACGAIRQQFRNFRRGDQIYKPDLPKGWINLNNVYFCPAHKVLLVVDGEVRPWPS
jgi:hypothetical protein